MIKVIILLLAAWVNLFAREPREYVISTWNLDEGLPQSTVNEIVQTRDGYLWLATWGGLVRFDGVKFTVFDRSNSPGLVNDRVMSLFEDKDGALWISTEKGLILYKNGVFLDLSKTEGFPEAVSFKVKQDKNGGIWLFTPLEAFKLVKNRYIKQHVINDNLLRQKALSGQGDFWYVTEKKVIRLIEGKLVSCINMDIYTNNTIWDVVENKKSVLWIATNGDGVFKFNKGKVSHYTEKDGLFSDRARKFLIDKKGYLWVIGIGGISRISTGSHDKIYSIFREDGLSDSDVICFIQDSEENYWAGTVTGGLNKLRKSFIAVYGENQGLQNDKLLSLCFRKNGNLFIGTNCGGIYELSKGKISYSHLNKFLLNTCIWSVFEDSKQRVWISAKDLILAEGNQIKYFNPDNGFTGSTMYAIYEDHKGTVWFGCGNGLFFYSDGKVLKYSDKNGLVVSDVRAIFEDRQGILWIGTTNGLKRITNNGIEDIKLIEDLASNYIRAIYQDKEDLLWFGLYGGGLLRLKNNQFKSFTVKDGLFDNIVSHIVEDDYGYFWMGSNKGISRVRRSDLNDYAEGVKKTIYVTSCGKQDGMISVETNGGFQPSAVKDKSGKIYFPTVKGLAVINPAETVINEVAPPVFIEKVFVSGKKVTTDLKQNVLIPYDSTDIQIEYTALSYIDNKKVKFKYKIDSYDENWIDAGARRSAYYTKIPPGEYRFRIIASNNDGIWNDRGASMAFTILPPFWMTWWFRTAIILTVLSIGPAIYYRRVNKLKAEKLRQEEFSWMLIRKQEEERSRIAQELHDSLGQELMMIKNRALLGIKNTDEATKPRQQLEYISESATSVINLVRHISHNLRPPELDRLGLTETIRSILSDLNDTGEIKVISSIENIDGLLVKDNEINVVRIIQEALSNILKHSEASEVEVNLLYSKNNIALTISDNGKGFLANKPVGSNGNSGLGLTGMMERVHILGGNFYIDSNPGKGTQIDISIPVSERTTFK